MLRTARKRMIPAPWSGDECPSKLWLWKISLGYMYHALYQTLHMDAPACTRYMLQIIIVRKIVCKIVKADVHWLALVSKELPFAMECCHKTTPKIANSKWGLIDDRYPREEGLTRSIMIMKAAASLLICFDLVADPSWRELSTEAEGVRKWCLFYAMKKQHFQEKL